MGEGLKVDEARDAMHSSSQEQDMGRKISPTSLPLTHDIARG